MKERLTKERLEQLKQRYRDFGRLHWMDAQEIVIELEQVQSELTEKDATIKELEQGLSIKTEVVEIKDHKLKVLARQVMDEVAKSAKAIAEQNRLRKALEEARNYVHSKILLVTVDYEHATGKKKEKLKSVYDSLAKEFEFLNSALGEGDKE